MKLARIADRVARDIYRREIVWTYKDSVIRDASDAVTGSELSFSMLDRLSDIHGR